MGPLFMVSLQASEAWAELTSGFAGSSFAKQNCHVVFPYLFNEGFLACGNDQSRAERQFEERTFRDRKVLALDLNGGDFGFDWG